MTPARGLERTEGFLAEMPEHIRIDQLKNEAFQEGD